MSILSLQGDSVQNFDNVILSLQGDSVQNFDNVYPFIAR